MCPASEVAARGGRRATGREACVAPARARPAAAPAGADTGRRARGHGCDLRSASLAGTRAGARRHPFCSAESAARWLPSLRLRTGPRGRALTSDSVRPGRTGLRTRIAPQS